MTEEDVRNAMQEGINKITPISNNIVNELMQAYQIGFETCFKLLTGHNFGEIK